VLFAREKQTLLNKLNLQYEILSASVASDSVVCVRMQFYACDAYDLYRHLAGTRST